MKEYAFRNITNFRDLGGYASHDGRHVKYGHFFRSAGIDRMDEADWALMESLHIRHDLDFRGTKESTRRPDVMPEGTTIHLLPAMIENPYTLSHTLNFFDLLSSDMTPEEVVESNRFLYEVYGFLAFDNAAFRTMMDLIRRQETPILYHCSGGKDRTGAASILILKLLGADDEVALKDYLQSNVHVGKDGYIDQQLTLKGITDPVMVKTIWETCGVNQKFFDTFCGSIRERYGDFDTYFLKEYGIDAAEQKRLQDLYLE